MPSLIEWLARSTQQKTLYHFTDTRNLASIRQHGLLSVREIERNRVQVTAPGGNNLSRTLDHGNGMDRYVHLCMLPEHPMEYRAKQDGRIAASTFIPVSRQVLLMPNVLFTDQVANANGIVTHPLAAAEQQLDLDVIYNWVDWKDAAIRERRQMAKKYEILVPDRIPLQYLTLPRG